MRELFNSGKSLEDYFQQGESGIKRKIERLYGRIGDVEFPGRNYTHNKVLLFSETWCPDCLVIIAALKYLQEKIPVLEVQVQPQEPNAPILERHSADGMDRIPLILFLAEDFTEKAFISETPAELGPDIKKDPEKHKQYRMGAYMNEVVNILRTYIEG